MKLRDEIKQSIESFLAGVIQLGGEGELVFDLPLPRKRLKEITEKYPLPPGAYKLFNEISGHIKCDWSLDDDALEKLGEAFEDCGYGSLDLHPECFETVDESWSCYEEEAWPDKIVFAPAGNGDYLGIEPGGKSEGKIVFLSHEFDPDSNGHPIADNLVDLITRWSKLGFVGPDFESLAPFIGKRPKVLTPGGAAAKRYLKIIAPKKSQKTSNEKSDASLKKAKASKYTKLFAKIEKITGAPDASFERLLKGLSGKEKLPRMGAKAKSTLLAIQELFGVEPSKALRSLIIASRSDNNFMRMAANPPALDPGDEPNAFLHAAAVRYRLLGAFTNSVQVGTAHPMEHYFVAVAPDSGEVSVNRPTLEMRSLTETLPAFAQLLEVDNALENVSWDGLQKNSPENYKALCAAMAPLLSQTTIYEDDREANHNPLNTLLSHFSDHGGRESEASRLFARAKPVFSVIDHCAPPKLERPAAFPDDIDSLSCGGSLYQLWAAYFSAPEKTVRALCARAETHDARLVRDAGALVEKLLQGSDPLHPANYLHHARRMYTKGWTPKVTGRPKSADAVLKVSKTDSEETAEYKQKVVGAIRDGEYIEGSWSNLAYHYKRNREWKALLSVTAWIIHEGTALDRAWSYRAHALAGMDRLEEALEACDHALLYDRIHYREVYQLKADTLASLNHFEAVRDHCRFSGSTESSNFRQIVAAAQAHFKKGEYAETIKVYEGLSPSVRNREFGILSNLAYCYQNLGDQERSLEHFEAALKLEPDKLHLWKAICYTYYELKRWDDMQRCAGNAVRIDPKDSYSWQQVAIACAMLEDHEGAVEANRKAIKLEPRNGYAHYNLAWELYQMNDEGCIATFGKAFKLAPALINHARKDKDLAKLRKNPDFAALLSKK